MSLMYKGFDLNDLNTPKPWALRETNSWLDLVNTAVGDTLTDFKEVSGHKHNKIYSPLGVAGIEIGAAGDAQALSLTVAGVVTNQATGSLGTVAVLPINLGGTNSDAALNNDRVMVSNGGKIVEDPITAAELALLGGMVSVSTGASDNDKFVTQGYVDDAGLIASLWDRSHTTLSPGIVGDNIAVENNLLSNQSDGNYLGRTHITENQLALSNFGNTWVQKGTVQSWYGIAMSSDGKIQTAVAFNVNYIWTSADYGATWVQKGIAQRWTSIAMSSDGKIQTAVAYNDSYIYVSDDYGDTWVQKGTIKKWKGVAMSSDGEIQTAVSYDNYIWTSADYGDTWIQKGTIKYWYDIAMSSDGKIQTAVAFNGYIYISNDYGDTWIQKGTVQDWNSVAMSSDGKIQTAIVYDGYIWISSDYGDTWIQKETVQYWYDIAMSSDGKIQTVSAFNDYLYISDDYGDTWIQKETVRGWHGIAMSSDGKIQTAVCWEGYIYVSRADSVIRGKVTLVGSLELANGTSINNIVAATAYTDTDNCIWTGSNIIDYVESQASGGNYWDRAGTVLSPHTAGDNVATTGVITGNSLITGGDIGVAADADLIQLADDTIQINGHIGIKGAPGNWHTDVRNVIQFDSSVAGHGAAIYQKATDFGMVVNAIYDATDDRWEWMTTNAFANRIKSLASEWDIEVLADYSHSVGDEIVWDNSNCFSVQSGIGTHVNFNQKDYDFSVHANGIANALHVDGATGRIGIGWKLDADWDSNFKVLSIGIDGANSYKHSIYTNITDTTLGIVTGGVYYDATDTRWEHYANGFSTPVQIELAAGRFDFKIADGSTSTAGTEVFFNKHFIVDRYNIVHYRYDNNSSPASLLLIKKKLSSGVVQPGLDDDVIGSICFQGYNDAGTPQDLVYGAIKTSIEDASDGVEKGKVSIWEYVDGVDTEVFTIVNGNSGIDNASPERLLTVGGAHDNPAISLNRSTITWTANQKTAFGCVDGEGGFTRLASDILGGIAYKSFSKGAASDFNAVSQAYSENDLTTYGSFLFVGFKHDGSGGLTDHGDAAKIFEVRNNTSILMTILGNSYTGIDNASPERLLTVGGATDYPTISLNRSTITWTTDQKSAFGCVDGEAGNYQIFQNTTGGIYHRYFSKAAASGVNAVFYAFSENDLTFQGSFAFRAYKHDGSGGLTDHGDAAKIFEVRNNATSLMTILGNSYTGIDNASPSRLLTVGGATDYPTISLNRSTITWTANQKSAFGCVDGEGGNLTLYSNTTGGIYHKYISKAAASGFNALFQAFSEHDLTTQGSFLFVGFKHDGSGSFTTHGASAKIFEVRNYANTLMTIKGNANTGIDNALPSRLLTVGGAHDDPTISLNRSTITWTADQKSAFGCVDGEAGNFMLRSGLVGGLDITSYSKSVSGVAIAFNACSENDLTAYGSFIFRAYKHDGSGSLTAHGNSAKIFEIRNDYNILMTILGDGNMAINGNATLASNKNIVTQGTGALYSTGVGLGETERNVADPYPRFDKDTGELYGVTPS